MKTTKTAKSVTLWKDQPVIDEMNHRLENLLPLAQAIIDSYFKLPFADPEADFFNIIVNTEGAASDYVRKNIPDSLNVSGMTIDRNKFAQFMTPEGMDKYRTALQSFTAAGGSGLTSYFKLKGNFVIIDDNALQQYSMRYTIAAETPDDLEMYQLWQGWVEATAAFSNYMRKKRDMLVLTPGGTHLQNSSAFLRLDKNGEPCINHITFQAAQRTVR